ncbi:uncharacterized protein F5Z01DRAFT_640403 [Emericellopsis atlantica]|uniref:ABM domain-containing protein n=1 Tax=Emericellopsis atlantica TaxID=2614577 RepID=A0A9P7ZEZ9_9HYPO|nr:uncharacterized protein F5Z01DRAFT_640403 [Emericellopsis atlantica]KAG9250263.1 hypothetical protein F5Z01DRAFT_640403 [Emericellopsis atlantica]
MTVTEFALLKLSDAYEPLELYELLMECFEIQDTWVRKHQPELRDPHSDANLSSVYVDRSSTPHTLLITAQWSSPEAHHQWVASEENQMGFAAIKKFLAEGEDSMVLFHMAPAGLRQKGAPPKFTGQGTFEVERIFIRAEERPAVQEKYRKLEGTLLDLKIEDPIWAGWRLEKESPETDELVVFYSQSQSPLGRTVEKLDVSHKKQVLVFEHIIG